MKSTFTFALVAMISICVHAQTQTGKVLDAVTGQPLSGATIKIHGKTVQTTREDGSFGFDCARVKSFDASFVGYEPFTFFVRNCDEPVSIRLQPLNKYLNEIEVSASSVLNKTILYQPASIAKLGTVELKRGIGLFMDDAINANVPGVTMNRRTISGGQQFNIRGYGNGTRGTRGISSNFDGQGYKVYLNGIPVTDAEGITVMDDMDFGSIGNVEVTRGPSGSLYGLAIAGVVNLKTVRPPRGKTSLAQEVMVGNYGLRRYTTQLQLGQDKFSLLLNYGHQQSDGVSFHNRSEKDFVNLFTEFQPNDKQSLSVYFGYSDSYDQRIGELTLAQWAKGDFSGNPEYIKRAAHSAVRTARAGVVHRYAFNQQFSNETSIFGTGLISDASSAGGWTDKNYGNFGLRSVINARFSLGSKLNLTGITGIETQGQRGQTIGYSMKKSPFDTSTVTPWNPSYPFWVINAATSNFLISTGTTSLFTEWSLQLPADISLTAGIGWSNQKINLFDRFNTATVTKPSEFDTVYKNMLSPHLAINKVFNKNLSVYASYRKGFKPPVSSYFFIATPQVNTVPVTPAGARVNGSLQPEIGSQYEIGSKGRLLNDRLSYDFAVYQAVFDRKMTTVAVASPLQPNTTLYSYVVNGGRQVHKGLEFLVKYTAFQSEKSFFRIVRPFANVAYTDYRYEDFKFDSSATKRVDFSGNEVAAVARWVFNAGVDLDLRYGFYANINVNYRGRMPITADNLYYTDAYMLLNGKIGFQRSITKHFDIDAYFGAANMTNVKHYIMVFANQLPDAYVPAPRYANIFGGFSLRYNF